MSFFFQPLLLAGAQLGISVRVRTSENTLEVTDGSFIKVRLRSATHPVAGDPLVVDDSTGGTQYLHNITQGLGDITVYNESGRERVYDYLLTELLDALDLSFGEYIPGAAGPIIRVHPTDGDLIVVTDGSLQARLRSRDVLDVLLATDSALQSRLRSRMVSDTFTLADALAFGLVQSKLITDTLVSTDGFLRDLFLSRTVSDSFAMTFDTPISQVIGTNIYVRTHPSAGDLIVVTDAGRNVMWLATATAFLELLDSKLTPFSSRTISDYIVVTDFGTPQKVADAVMSDAVDSVTDAGRMKVMVVTATALLTLFDEFLGAGAEGEIFVVTHPTNGDLVVVSDGQMKMVLRQRTILETMVLVDAVTRTRYVGAVLSDVLSLTDSALSQRFRSRAVLDVLTPTDPTLARRHFSRLTQLDVLAVTDATSKRTTRGPTSTDTLAVTDGTVSRALRQRLLSDAVPATDEIFFAKLRQRFATDTLTLADTVLLYYLRNRETTDNIAVLDEIISNFRRVWLKTLPDDYLEVADSAVAQFWRSRASTETVGVNDLSLGQALRNRLTSEALAVIDAAVASALRVRDRTDAVPVTDEALRQAFRYRVLGELLTLDDSLIKVMRRVVVVSDLLAVIDEAFTAVGGNKVRTITDLAEVLDGSFREVLRQREITDTLAIAETVLRHLVRVVTADENVTLHEALVKVMRLVRDMPEAIELSDPAIVSVLYAVYYDVRVFLGLDLEGAPEIGTDEPIFIAVDQSPVLGGYN